MNTPKLAWYQLSRDELPEVAVGMPVPKSKNSRSEPSIAFNPDLAGSVGFAWDGSNSLEYHPPAIFALQNQNIRETLSWLRVYARDAFPLSQFGRVMTVDDWRLLTEEDCVGRSFRDDRWASVVLGELLAQSDQDAPLDSLPVGRAAACFSTAVARAHKLYDSYSATRTCTERLRAIESDTRFVRRSVSVESLVPAWSMASASFGSITSASELAEFIITAADSYKDGGSLNASGKRLRLPSGLYSDSIEERVVAFQQAATEATAFVGNHGSISTHAAAVVAASAFLVGRGTSHSFLIKKHARLIPLAHIWFGVLAGVAGPKFWDPGWTKALKGIEKHIRASFCWSDPPMADISWAEYDWVSNAVKGHQAFAGISRQVSTSLSIEVLPGASCQMRLHIDESKHQPKSMTQPPQGQPTEQPSNRLPAEVVVTLEQILTISEKAREILGVNTKPLRTASPKNSSSDLFREEDGAKNKRAPRKSKGK